MTDLGKCHAHSSCVQPILEYILKPIASHFFNSAIFSLEGAEARSSEVIFTQLSLLYFNLEHPRHLEAAFLSTSVPTTQSPSATRYFHFFVVISFNSFHFNVTILHLCAVHVSKHPSIQALAKRLESSRPLPPQNTILSPTTATSITLPLLVQVDNIFLAKILQLSSYDSPPWLNKTQMLCEGTSNISRTLDAGTLERINGRIQNQ